MLSVFPEANPIIVRGINSPKPTRATVSEVSASTILRSNQKEERRERERAKEAGEEPDSTGRQSFRSRVRDSLSFAKKGQDPDKIAPTKKPKKEPKAVKEPKPPVVKPDEPSEAPEKPKPAVSPETPSVKQTPAPEGESDEEATGAYSLVTI